MEIRGLSIACVLGMLLASFAAAGEASDVVDAAEARDWDRLGTLIQSGRSLDARQPDGMTALHWAARWNAPVAISALVSADAQVDAASEYGVTPLAIACRYGHLNAAAALLEAGADPNQTTAGGETMLMHAARTGNAALVRRLLAVGADPDAEQREGQTALMWAAAAGHHEVVDLLLKADADWTTMLDSGFTALHFAARQGHAHVVRRLLDAGADVNQPMKPRRSPARAPRNRMSPLMLAVESAHFELALQLVDWGADPNDQRSGYAPLHALSWVRRPPRGDNPMGDPPPDGSGNVGSLQFVRELVARGADVNLQLKRGRYSRAKLNPKRATPLLFAAYTSDLPYAKLLVDLGADVQRANADGTTPMLAAAGVGIFVADEYPGTEAETLAMVDQLVQWGGRLDDVDQHNETVIHGAAYRSFPKVVDRLVALGADPHHWHRKNELGSTPREVAQGKRPGSFKPNPPTVAAIDRALKAAGIPISEWTRPRQQKKKWQAPQ